MLEHELVHAVVDYVRLLHALAQIRSARGSRSGHAISSWDEASVKPQPEQAGKNEDTGRKSQVENAAEVEMVGPWGLEPQTSTVSTYHRHEIQQLTTYRGASFSLFYT